jgi:predicted nuclease with TOPRIM domain
VEWLLLLVDVVLAGLLVRIWTNYQVRANDLKRRRQAAVQRTEEHRQQIEVVRKEAAEVEARLPEIEELARTLKGELARAEDRLARLEATGDA